MPIIVQCEWCKREQSVTPTRSETYRFCSYKCVGEWRSKHWAGEDSPLWQGGVRSKTCENCGEIYSIKDNQPITTFRKQRFCSHACGVEGRNTRGGNNPNWKGGHSTRSSKQRAWANAVISRDGATCCRCGAAGVELHAHHIRSFKEHPELRWDPANGETLCFRCHWDEHTAGDANAVNSGKPLTGHAEGNPEPSLSGNIREGVTTRGRAYRRWDGHCGECGTFVSRRLSDTKGKNAIFCDRVCRNRWTSRMKTGKPKSSRYGSNASTSAARESDDIVWTA
jgi:5-methylcytosine-specific restriction endonuclease McrA